MPIAPFVPNWGKQIASSLLANDASLALHWKFNESSGNASASVGGITLTNNNTVGFVLGNFENCADFGSSNTNKYFTNASTLAWNTYDTGLSISFWVNFYNFTSTYDLFGFQDTSWSGVFCRVNSATSITFRFGNGISSDGGNTTVTVPTMSASRWYNITMTHSASANNYYLNGTLIGTRTSSVTLSGGGSGLAIGQTYGSGVNFASVKIDDFSVFTRELSSGDVVRIAGATGLHARMSGSSSDASSWNNTGSDTAITYIPDDSRKYLCANFNGTTSRISYGSLVHLQSSIFTYATWIRPTSVAVAGTIVGGSTGSPPQFRFETNNTIILNKTGVTTIGTSSRTIPINRWSHVAVTYDASGNYAFYINGKIAGTGTNVQTFTWGNYYIGSSATSEFFTGQIRDVIIENRVWNPLEIGVYYQRSTFNWKRNNWLATLASVFYLNASTVAFTLTGNTVTFSTIYRLIAATASFVLTGYSATLRKVGGWINDTKHTSTFTNGTKHTSTFTNETKH